MANAFASGGPLTAKSAVSQGDDGLRVHGWVKKNQTMLERRIRYQRLRWSIFIPRSLLCRYRLVKHLRQGESGRRRHIWRLQHQQALLGLDLLFQTCMLFELRRKCVRYFGQLRRRRVGMIRILLWRRNERNGHCIYFTTRSLDPFTAGHFICFSSVYVQIVY